MIYQISRICFSILLVIRAWSLTSQEIIPLQNPSFESPPRRGSRAYNDPIMGWQDCGSLQFPGESAPDIHPVPGNAWGVRKKAIDGKTYLGLVLRDNGSWEAFNQELNSPLQAHQCYQLEVYLSMSPEYKSGTRSSDTIENFSHPAIFRIWGGNSSCERDEILLETSPVGHTDWKLYRILFRPEKQYSFIMIEAYFSHAAKEAYNGHILIDGMSDLIPINCE